MTTLTQRPLTERVRRWETPFERDAVSLVSLSFDADEDRLVLVLERQSDKCMFRLEFVSQHFRVMDEIGWSGESLWGDLSSLHDEPLSSDRPLTTLLVSNQALGFDGWPDVILAGGEGWVHVIWTRWSCIDVVTDVAPKFSVV